MMKFEQEPKESPKSPSKDNDIFIRKEELSLGKDQKVPVEFLFVAHAPEYAPQIAEATKDATLVAVESVGGDEISRTLKEITYNVITHEKNTEQIEKIVELAEHTGMDSPHSFNMALALALQGTDKEIIFVDMTKTDEKRFNLYTDEYLSSLSNLEKYLYQNSPESGISELPHTLQTLARHNSKREELVVTQLKEIIKERRSRSKEPLRVAVIQGMVHTPSSHLLSKEEGYETNRSFIPRIESEIVPKGTKAIYSYLNQGMRTVELAQNKKVPQELLEKIILEAYLAHITKGLQLPFLDMQYLTRRFTDSFNSNERKDIFAHITHDIHTFLPETKEDVHTFTSILEVMSSLPQEMKDEMLTNALKMRVSHSLILFLTKKYDLPPPPKSILEVKNFLNAIKNRPSNE